MFSPPRYESSPGYTTSYRPAPPHPAGPSAYRYAYATPTKDSSKRHLRTGSHGVAPTYTYAPPPQTAPPAYYASSPYAPSGGYYYSPARPAEYVSGSDRLNRPRTSVRQPPPQPQPDQGPRIRVSLDAKFHSAKVRPSRAQNVYPDGVFDDEGYSSPGKGYSPPPPYHNYASGIWVADPNAYGQVPHYKGAKETPPKYKSTSTRQRSASYSNHNTTPRPKSSSKSKPAPRKATAADAAAARIPAGFSYKNWDPTEEPILLLGSVFDANSLGKWIYDFTVYHHGAATPMSDLAGDLWLLLIQLAGKIKRAEECKPRIRHPEDVELVEDFLDSGDRLWDRFNKILKNCEDQMWRIAQKEAKKKGTTGAAQMGTKAGCEFVDTIFGRDRQLGETEKLMQGMRLWSHRFEVNCEDIMRHPAA